jgi:poly(A) polymerase
MQQYLQNPLFKVISSCADDLQMECYVIGGFVRDIFLHRASNDIDVVVVGSGIAMAEAIKQKLGKQATLAVFKNFGTAQIKYKDTEIELVGARKESYNRGSRKPIVEDGTLQDDQNRRDFTINALAICLNANRYGELVDPFGGIQAIEHKIIKTPLNPDITFSDDPLRMMRCIRFATQLHFHIEDETYQSIIRNKKRIEIVSKERIVDELNKIMRSVKPSIGFALLKKTGLLAEIMPEIDALSGIETKNGKSHKDVFWHTLEVVDKLAEKSDNLWLRWAALFHDVGKPASKRFDNKIGWTFHNHNYIGERMIPRIFKQMKMPMNENMRFVQKIVTLHMRPIALVEDEITDSAVRRLLFEAGDDIDDLMLLCEADITSKNEVKAQKYLQNLQIVRQKLKDIEQKDHVRNFQPPIDGKEIMELFHLPPCAEVGAIKMAIKDAILDGVIPNEYDAAYAFMMEKAKEMGLK